MEQQKQECVEVPVGYASTDDGRVLKITTAVEARRNGDKYYFTGVPCKNGHTSERFASRWQCASCNKERRAYQTEYREKNKTAIIAKQKEYRIKNLDVIRRKGRARSRNPEYAAKKSEYDKAYVEANRSRIYKRSRDYYHKNPVSYFIRGTLKRVMNDWKGTRLEAEKMLGYTLSDLNRHLESNFKPGMSWENYGEWHIDHKKPVIAFVNSGVTDPKIVNDLDNLQPLWAKDNIKKGEKWNENE